MNTGKIPVFTMGYEGTTIDSFTKVLVKNKIKTLLDVRAVPLSRKPGFSKNKLASFLAQEGISYVGLKGLGTPAEGRAAARQGQKSELERIFGEHLHSDDAVRDLKEAIRISNEVPACLLCFEHSPHCCHRRLVAEAIRKTTHQEIVHLDATLGGFLL